MIILTTLTFSAKLFQTLKVMYCVVYVLVQMALFLLNGVPIPLNILISPILFTFLAADNLKAMSLWYPSLVTEAAVSLFHFR